VVFVFFAIFGGANGFISLNGTASWADSAAELGIVAVPVGVLMIAGEFDLSIAATIGMSSLIIGLGTGHFGWPLIVSIAVAVFIGILVGLINGFVTVRTGLPSFIVTLATYMAISGASLYATRVITSTTTVSVVATGFLHSLFAGSVHQFNISILWCVLIVLGAAFLLNRSVFGNWTLATGGDKATARSAGVPTDRVKILLFVATSLGATLLGVIQALEYNGGQVGQGNNFIFEAIVASVVGGVLLQGGYGSAIGVLFGSMTYAIVDVGIYYTGWDSDLAQVILGGLVLLAVLTNSGLRRFAISR
jgi:simple sugar transport system permease protein